MPQQLIYTSAPRGVVAGRSGHCTVARSANLREAVMLQVEKFCYYQHLSLSGGQERPIFTCRVIDIRGTRFHVLSRIQDAGLDFTGRTNFIAHHLVFTPEEIRQFPAPPIILRDWPGWRTEWTHEPQLFENEDWSSLTLLAGKTSTPAQTWEQLTGDAVNGYGLLEARAGASFRVDDVTAESVLTLMAESLELLEVRDPRKDFRSAIWQYTFTTSLQEQDNPADFRWRCIHSDNPTASRFTPPDCKPLTAVRASKWTAEEAAMSQRGRQAPRFVKEPQDTRITEAQTARFVCQAEGIPMPVYEWFTVDRTGQIKMLPGETKSELLVANPPFGISRYLVRARNGLGQVQSGVATLSVEQILKPRSLPADSGKAAEPVPVQTLRHSKSKDAIDQQRQQLALQAAEAIFRRRLRRNKLMAVAGCGLLILLGGVFLVANMRHHRPAFDRPMQPMQVTYGDSAAFTATAKGSLPLTYQWFENTTNLISGATNETYTIKTPGIGNAGTYRVVVTNPYGRATNIVELKVSPAPLTITANDQIKPYGQPFQFKETEFKAEGLLSNDTVSSVTLSSIGATNPAPPGPYPIVATNAVGSNLTNYQITYTTGTLRVEESRTIKDNVSQPAKTNHNSNQTIAP